LKTLAETLRRTASWLSARREPLREAWTQAVAAEDGGGEAEARAYCTASLNTLLARLEAGELEAFLEDEARAAAAEARTGQSFLLRAAAIRTFGRCCLPVMLAADVAQEELAETLVALGELGARRLEILLVALEDESARRLVEAQEQAARVAERARETALANEALRRAQAQSQHRADQLGLLASVAHRIAPVLEPQRLMQEAAETIQTRMNHTYVAVVVLDEAGVLVGRWAGRPGVGRRSGGRAQGPPGGIIGRALRARAPQVVGDVSRDPDYLADVPGTRSEMVVPLLDGGRAVGALDFQSEKDAAFDLDDVAAAETLAEFLIVSLRNARLYEQARRAGGTP
jgi:putative methionine-R-sulfoxide reductase with GAF domain